MRLVTQAAGAVTEVHPAAGGRGGPGLRVLVMDSVAFATPEHAGQVIVTGSHGGTSAGEYARRCGVAAVVCNDAGGGKNGAGVAGLRALDEAGIAGVAVGHDTARIGDGTDAWENGVVSFVNETARAAGLRPGLRLREAVGALVRARGEGAC